MLIKKPTKKMVKKTIEKMNVGFIVFGLSFISFYTSYEGLLKISGVTDNTDKAPMLFMAILIGILQYILVFSINKFYIRDLFKKYWLKSLFILSAYLITTIISISFSFSFWYETFSAENYAKRSSELQLNIVRDNIINAKQDFKIMGDSLLQLSKESAITSKREKNYGRTCNSEVGAGEGYYTWLRADDSRETEKYSKDLLRLELQLDDEMHKISSYLQSFDPKGDVVTFNRKVNNHIKEINMNFFQNPILGNLKRMLINRTGENRKHIRVIHRETKQSSIQSCMDSEFTDGANRVIKLIDNLKVIEGLHFFDINDKSKLFDRTTSVLFAMFNPSYEIKSSTDMSSADDITDDDLKAVSFGFIIDFLILIITLYAKEKKDNYLSKDEIDRIMDNSYTKKILNIINPFLAETGTYGYLLAVPKNLKDDDKTARLKQFILYFQEQKLVHLIQNEISVDGLTPYFNNDLYDKYQNTTFKVYKIELNKILLLNID